MWEGGFGRGLVWMVGGEGVGRGKGGGKRKGRHEP